MKPYFPTTYGRKAVWINLQKHMNIENLCLMEVLKILVIEEVETLYKWWYSNANRKEGTKVSEQLGDIRQRMCAVRIL